MDSKNQLAVKGEHCELCHLDNLVAVQGPDGFRMLCSMCGKRGPEARSVYEAQSAFSQMEGRPSLGMSDMVRGLSLSLILIGVGLLIANAIFG